jgi:hypothetical protein
MAFGHAELEIVVGRRRKDINRPIRGACNDDIRHDDSTDDP